jgi:hypothetical protein
MIGDMPIIPRVRGGNEPDAMRLTSGSVDSTARK